MKQEVINQQHSEASNHTQTPLFQSPKSHSFILKYNQSLLQALVCGQQGKRGLATLKRKEIPRSAGKGELTS